MAISHPIILRYVASCSRIFKVSQQIFHVCWQVSCGLPTSELLSHSVQSWRHGSHRTAKNERSPPLKCLCMTYRSEEGGECLCSTLGPSQGKAEPVLTRKGQEARMPDSLAETAQHPGPPAKVGGAGFDARRLLPPGAYDVRDDPFKKKQTHTQESSLARLPSGRLGPASRGGAGRGLARWTLAAVCGG